MTQTSGPADAPLDVFEIMATTCCSPPGRWGWAPPVGRRPLADVVFGDRWGEPFVTG